jgi:hypothetical protein
LHGAELAIYLHDVARYLPGDGLPHVYDLAAQHKADAAPDQRELLLALDRAARERGTTPPASLFEWAMDVARQLLADERAPAVQAGLELAQELRLKDLYGEMEVLASPQSRFADLRAAAIDACVANDAERSVSLLSQIVGNASEPLSLRQKAAGGMGNITVPPASAALVKHLAAAPDRLAIAIAAGLAMHAESAELLLAEISAGRASPRLLQEPIVQELLKRAKVVDLDERLAALNADLPPAE